MQIPFIDVGGCRIDLRDLPQVVAEVQGSLSGAAPAPLAIASVNLDHFWHFGRGAAHAQLFSDEDPSLTWLMLLDSTPITWLANHQSQQTWPRLAGSDLLEDLLVVACQQGARVGFLGGRRDMHERLGEVLASTFPALEVAGYWAPSRTDLDDDSANEALLAELRAARVDLLVVGLGKPRQEQWIQRHGPKTGAGVLLAFGASADFMAGMVPRAPNWVRNSGLEWLYRLSREPRRLSRRYLLQGPQAAARIVPDVLPWRQVDVSSVKRQPRRIEAVTVVVVTYRSLSTIDRLLDSIPAATEGLTAKVVVVDNASPDGTADHVRQRGNVHVIESAGNLGFAAGINLGRSCAEPGSAVAIINPDAELGPRSLTILVEALSSDRRLGAVVPLILEESEERYPSLRREPSVAGALGDALFGSHWRRRPQALSDTVWASSAYARAHDVDWASGAAWVVSPECNADVGPWDERFFLYSEETEYARRIRRSGRRMRFVPEAQVTHIGGGSGSSYQLDALLELNRILDFGSAHGRLRTAAFRGCVILKLALRIADPGKREVLRIILSSERSKAIFRGDSQPSSGSASKS